MVKLKNIYVYIFKKMTEINIGNLTFREVEYKKLKHQKYIIKTESYYLKGKFLEKVGHRFIQLSESGRGYFESYGARFFISGYFESCDSIFLIRGICTIRTFNHNQDYYELIPKKQLIQQNMEYRSINMIIRKILNDDYFKW
jgi:hypothetical protein